MLRARTSKRTSSSPYARGGGTKAPGSRAKGAASREPPPSHGQSSPTVSQSSTLSESEPPTPQSAGSAIPTICGGSGNQIIMPNLVESANINPLVSVHDTIGLFVSEPIKEKILAGAYVDFASLVQINPDIEQESHTISLVDGSLVLKPKKPTTKITSIESWSDAFLVFASIYLSKHPDQALGLIKYMHSVRLGASRHGGAGWMSYDKQFRLKKANNPAATWGAIDGELWMLYMQGAQVANPKQFAYGQAKPTSGPSKCFDFNFKGVCGRPACVYSHSCIKCSGNHQMMYCKQGPPVKFNESPQYQVRPRFQSGQPYSPRHQFRPNIATQYRNPRPRFMGIGSHTN